jgi:hypothetical protein
MTEELKKEIEEIIRIENLSCSVEEFIIEANDPIYRIPIEEVPSMEGKKRVCIKTTLWSRICQHCSLSEDLMREFIELLHWPGVSCHQKLSIEFVREFKHKIHWYWHTHRTDLSYDFILEFEKYLDWEYLMKKKYYISDNQGFFNGDLDFSLEEYKRFKEENKIHSRFGILDL